MSSRESMQAIRRHADRQSERLVEMPGLRGAFLTVASVTGGVFLSWRGATIEATRVLPHVTPGVGDRVLVLDIDHQIVVIG